MDIQNPVPQQNPQATQNTTTQPQQPSQQQPYQMPQPKKTSPWVWILGGCLIISILIVVVIGLLGFWGARKLKSEYDKNAPSIEKLQQSAEEIQMQQEEWQEMSNDIQQDLSDIEQQMPGALN